jgi:Raf kinase inhibitor-like YbhB/YbcL family protein
MIGAACRHDGRTLRPPNGNQNASISTLAESTTTDGFSDGGTLDSSLTDDTSDFTLDGTLPASDEFVLTAPWNDGGAIPGKYTCDGTNVSPAVTWTAAPDGTAAIAVTLADLDAPTFAHRVVAGIASSEVGLSEDAVPPLGAVEATNGAGAIGYTGPCPPAGSTHHYVLKVHYLGTVVNLTDGATAKEMTDAINAAEIASAEVTGTYNRP